MKNQTVAIIWEMAQWVRYWTQAQGLRLDPLHKISQTVP